MKPHFKRYLCVLLLLSGIYHLSIAQEVNTTDTIARKIRYFAVDNPMWLNESVESHYSRIRIQYNQEDGGYRMAQQADRTRQFAFKSEGSLTIKDVRLWGSFSYRNAKEDSTRFGHQTRQNPEAPFYFASYGANHYERTDYRIQVRGQRFFNNNRWSVYAGLDYTLGDHFSNNDPRGSLDVFQLDGLLGVSYHFTNSWQLGLQGSYGYGQETVEVAFKNSNYADQAVESPYLNYTVFGYGWRVQDWLIDKGMNYQTNMKRPGVKGYISHRKEDQQYNAYIGVQNETQLYQQVLRNESRKNELTSYDSFAISYGLQWSLKRGQKQFYLNLHGQNKQGKDKLPEGQWNGVNNYIYDLSTYKIEGAYSLRKERWQYDYEAKFAYTQERKYDGGSGTRLDYTQLQPHVSFMLTHITANGQHLQFGVGALAQIRPALEWYLPKVNENAFHRYVFYHDVNYLHTNSYAGELKIGYRKPMRKQTYLHLGSRYQLTKAKGFEPQQGISAINRANERSRLEISLTYGF